MAVAVTKVEKKEDPLGGMFAQMGMGMIKNKIGGNAVDRKQKPEPEIETKSTVPTAVDRRIKNKHTAYEVA